MISSGTKALLIAWAVITPFLQAQTDKTHTVVPKANGLLLTSFGSAGVGNDDTAVFQAALNAAAIQGQTLEIPAGTYNVRPLYFPSNSAVVLAPYVAVQAMPGYGQADHLLNINDVQNVSITGTPGLSVFRMRKPEYISGEYRHCLAIQGATGVVVDGIQCNSSGGDGLYIGGGLQPFSNSVQIKNSGFDNNRRQGFSLTSGKNIAITNCSFTNTTGTAPASGIDIEPNQPSDVFQNIMIDETRATGNDGNGLVFGLERLNASSAPISIRVTDFTSTRNKQSGIFATNEQAGGSYSAPGSVVVTNATSTLDNQYGAIVSYWETGGASLTFQNLTVVNANGWKNNVDNAAITVKRGGGAVHPMGNVHFIGTSVIDTVGNLDTYFTVYDWSHIGITQLQFVNPGKLSGAKQATGLLNGLPALTVNVN